MQRARPFYSSLSQNKRSVRMASGKKSFLKPMRLLRWLLSLAVLGLSSVGIQNAYSSLAASDLFRIEQILVTGNRLLSAQEVTAQTGLFVGGNLFEADLAKATGRLRSHPMVREAFLQRQPPGTLVVSVAERQPIALASTPDGMRGLDREGAVFPLPQMPFDLPVVTGIEVCRRDSLTGEQKETLSRVGAFVESLRRETPTLIEDLSEIHVVCPTEAKVYMVGDGLEVRMRLSEAGAQAQGLLAYLAAEGGQGEVPAYVDLRFCNQVVVGRESAPDGGGVQTVQR